jgi:hypothetical protein
VEIGDALILELEGFARAGEVAQAAAKEPAESKGWREKLLGKAGTVAGSVKDIMETLPPFAKNALTLFKELTELFGR